MFEKMYANLHYHSTHSDGVDSPADLVKMAKEEGYCAVAIADHDTATGVAETIAECEVQGLEYLVGCEFSGTGFDTNFHIVGLDFDLENDKMQEYFSCMIKACILKTRTFFDAGIKRGTLCGITWEEVEALNPGIGRINCDRVFDAMKKKGIVTDADYSDFRKNNFSKSMPYKSPYKRKTVEEIIKLIKDAGGVPVLAHPGYEQMKLLPELIKMGVCGIEVWHPEHSDEEAAAAEELAKKYNLYIAGGTDHSGIMGGQYSYYEGKDENPYYIPSLKYGTSEENFRKLKERVLG